MVELFGVCASCTGKCCTNYAVALTLADIGRIYSATGGAEWLALEKKELHANEKKEIIIMVAGKPRVPLLKRDRLERCVFLNKDYSCRIYQSRPLVCKIYPFEQRQGKTVMKKDARCPFSWSGKDEIEIANKLIVLQKLEIENSKKLVEGKSFGSAKELVEFAVESTRKQ